MKTTAEQEQAVNTIYFGCDISKASFTVAARQAGLGPIQPAQLRKLTITRFERTAQGANKFLAMARQIAGKAEMVIVMESTGSYSLELCCWLWKASAGVPIAAVPPKRIHDWCSGTGVRAKTDNIDAALIACYGAERQPRAQDQDHGVYEDLRALTRTREAFVADRQATAQRLEELSRMPMDKKTARTLQASYKRILKELDRAIDQTEAAMMKLIEAHPQLHDDLKLGDTLPGMGPITVATILAEAGDLRLFTPQELTAFAGLDPVTRQSGTSVHSPKRMTRRGNTRIRRVLANAAWASTRTKADNPFKTAFRNLQTRNKPPLVALNAVMRKMLITLRAALIAGKYSPICAPPQPVGKL